MSPLISIIVPAYNAESTIYNCLRSCVCQSYQNLEIIVVDDSSTDKTPEIVDTLLQKYPVIKYIKIYKSGVTAARNEGIKQARGEYIFFLDADDELPIDSIKCLYDATIRGQCDVSTGTIVHENEEGALISLLRLDTKSELTGQQWLKSIRKTWHGHIWGILFRKTLFTPSPHCPLNLKIGEDLLQVVQIAARCQKIAVIEEIVYKYIKHPSSVMNSRALSCIEMGDDEEKLSLELQVLANESFGSIQTEYLLMSLYSILNIPDSKNKELVIRRNRMRLFSKILFNTQVIKEIFHISPKLCYGIIRTLFLYKSI